MTRGKSGLRRAQVLDYLIEFNQAQGRMPSHKEAHYDLKIKPATLNRILKALVIKSKIKKIHKSMPFKLTGDEK